MTAALQPGTYEIKWQKLPDDYVLDDSPVDNINQPLLAAALSESLELAGRLSETALATINYGICVTVNNQVVIKAPDWGFVPKIRVPKAEVNRSYTPQLQGELPLIVMEFLSDPDGSEYSVKPTYPYGKWFYYERILKVPYYAIFNPDSGELEFYRLTEGQYQLQPASSRYWIAEMELCLGVWSGSRATRTGHWLRWWDQQEHLLLWGLEQVEQERQRTEQERQRTERLTAQLRAAGIEPEA